LEISIDKHEEFENPKIGASLFKEYLTEVARLDVNRNSHSEKFINSNIQGTAMSEEVSPEKIKCCYCGEEFVPKPEIDPENYNAINHGYLHLGASPKTYVIRCPKCKKKIKFPL